MSLACWRLGRACKNTSSTIDINVANKEAFVVKAIVKVGDLP